MSKRAMVLLSGGLDSSMVLVQALRDGCEVAALTVFYGQPAQAQEESAAAATDSPTHSAPLCNVLSDFRAMKKAQGRAAGTLGMIGQKAAHLARILGNETAVRAIAPRDVDAYVATRQSEGATNHTIDKELGVLVGALKVAARHGLCDPPSTLRPPGFSSGYVPRVAVVASPDDLRALLAALACNRA